MTRRDSNDTEWRDEGKAIGLTILSVLHPRGERARIPRSEHELSAVLRHVALFTDVEGMLESALHHTFSSYVTSI